MPLDPLSALSVAASVIQFVDFSSKVVSKGRHIHSSVDGALRENIEQETIAKRLQSLAGWLELPPRSEDDTVATEQEQALQDICTECISLSKELVVRLEKLKVPLWAEQRKWKSCRQALKSVWSKKKLDEVAARLRHLRHELDSHVLYYLRSQVSAISLHQDERFKSLDEDSARIVEMLLKYREHIDNHFEKLDQSQKHEHESTRAAFINTDFQKRRKAAEKSLLKTLKFKTMRDRREGIEKAHKHTFQWIFKDPIEFNKPWDNFRDWLIAGQSLYWIQGKAGSGKSTLMEYISSHHHSVTDLQMWSGETEMNIVSFFFWNSGNLEQRSQTGLLRSLLFEILSQRTELIPDVFPDEWGDHCIAADSETPEEWTLPRLKIGFENLVRLTAPCVKLCFFIDGLDEFDGDHADIAAYFKTLSEYPHIKFCISSRPWPVFEDTFEGVPGLKLQDLTIDDIRLYVVDKLVQHKKMVELFAEDIDEAAALCQEILDKASGVFLWVSLVVKSLLASLRNDDGIHYLRRRLSEFPPELEPLYRHMLHGIEPIYREESSKIFQIFRASISGVDSSRQLTTISLDGALNADFITTMTARMQPLSITADQYGLRVKRHTRIANQLKSRTKGLLEVAEVHQEDQDDEEDEVEEEVDLTDPIDPENYEFEIRRRNCAIRKQQRQRNHILNYAPIKYLHRTVKDYLEKEEVWNEILSHTAHTNFDPTLSLLMLYIMELKTTDIALVTRSIYSVGEPALEISAHCKAATSKVQVLLLDELDRVLNIFWTNQGTDRLGTHWSHEAVEVARDLPPEWSSNFIVVAIRYNLACYLRTKIASNAISVKESNGLPLLAHAFSWILWATEKSPQIYPATIEMLLDYGADPNDVVRGATVWQHVLHYVHVAFDRWVPGLEEECLQWHAALKIMLEHGADPRACCIDYCRAWDKRAHFLSYHPIYMKWDWDNRPHFRQFSQLLPGQTPLLQPASGQSAKVGHEQHCAFHSVSAVVDSAFGERFPAGATELLLMLNKLIHVEDKIPAKTSTKRKARRVGEKRKKGRRIK